MLTPSGWAGEGSAVDHSWGTRAEPWQEAPRLGPQTVQKHQESKTQKLGTK